MILDLDNMTQAEFDKVMAEIKEKRPNLFQFIADFVDRKVSTEEVDEYLKMKREKQVELSRIIKRGHKKGIASIRGKGKRGVNHGHRIKFICQPVYYPSYYFNACPNCFMA